MRLLLDTHVVLWQLGELGELGPLACEAIAGAEELRFSTVSFAEIGIKAAVGKLVVPDGLHAHLTASGVKLLGLDPEHGLAVADLPMHHRDPFDRLLISQARVERLTIVTGDARFSGYDVGVLAATR